MNKQTAFFPLYKVQTRFSWLSVAWSPSTSAPCKCEHLLCLSLTHQIHVQAENSGSGIFSLSAQPRSAMSKRATERESLDLCTMNSWSKFLVDMCQRHIHKVLVLCKSTCAVLLCWVLFSDRELHFCCHWCYILGVLLWIPHLWNDFCICLGCCRVTRITDGEF